MRDHGYIVKPRGRVSLRSIAIKVRQAFNIEEPFLDIVRLLDVVLPAVYDQFEYQILEDAELDPDHARTYPEKKIIQVQQSVDKRARDFVGRDRFTLAHELGHLVLHQDADMGLRRAKQSDKAYECSEWQANCFAGELLIPHTHINKSDSIEDIMDRFRVSYQAAGIQFDIYQKGGLLT